MLIVVLMMMEVVVVVAALATLLPNDVHSFDDVTALNRFVAAANLNARIDVNVLIGSYVDVNVERYYCSVKWCCRWMMVV